jgi:hypothetical protein
MDSSLSKVEGGIPGHAKASKKRTSLQAMRPTTEKSYAAPRQIVCATKGEKLSDDG